MIKDYQKFIEDKFKILKHQDSIVYDGPNDLKNWKKQRIKILFYYKETYGYYDFGGTSISEQFEQWIIENNRTYKKMGLLAYLILKTEKRGRKIEYDKIELQKIYKEGHISLIEAMTNVAVINIGKISIPENKTSDSIIRDKSRENKEILKGQLKILNPDIIICGGRVTADSLYADLNYFNKNIYEHEIAELIDNKIIAPFNHLSICWYEKIYYYYSQIVNLMKIQP